MKKKLILEAAWLIAVLGCIFFVALAVTLYAQRIRVPLHNSRLGPVLPAPVAQNGNHYTIQICGDLNGEPMCSPIIATEITGTDPATLRLGGIPADANNEVFS